jgi:hypothetical protein
MKEVVSNIVLKIALYCSFIAMVGVDILRIGAGILAMLIGGLGIPRFVVGETSIFISAAILLILFNKWPWGIVTMSWIDMILIFTGVFPWGSSGTAGFFSQFTTDLIFFLAAHSALVCYGGLIRMKKPGELNMPTMQHPLL